MKYLIASGWWSCPPDEDSREALLGSDEIRDAEFHKIWRHCIDRFCDYDEILVVDSASPLKPEIPADEKWIEMAQNFGHSTSHSGKYSGYSRAIFISMMYAYANDFDYWVYIEQDVLISGDQIIQKAIESTPHSIIYGSGEGTPQQIQQSFMVFHRNTIIPFLRNYQAIQLTDKELSPEWKFLFAANRLAKYLPSSWLKSVANDRENFYLEKLRRATVKFIRLFDRFGLLPFGYGRARPIDFNQSHFYFQHGSSEELDQFLSKVNNDNERTNVAQKNT